jgi:hypothetical protein
LNSASFFFFFFKLFLDVGWLVGWWEALLRTGRLCDWGAFVVAKKPKKRKASNKQNGSERRKEKRKKETMSSIWEQLIMLIFDWKEPPPVSTIFLAGLQLVGVGAGASLIGFGYFKYALKWRQIMKAPKIKFQDIQRLLAAHMEERPKSLGLYCRLEGIVQTDGSPFLAPVPPKQHSLLYSYSSYFPLCFPQ